MKAAERKVHRILLLSLIFFLSGLAFFLNRAGVFHNKITSGKPGKVSLSPQGFSGIQVVAPQPWVLSNLPDPAAFRQFSLISKEDNHLTVSGECHDAYYTILIFSVDVDYRQSPIEAKFNSAFDCPAEKKFTQLIDLSSQNLPAGDYYLIRAQQGRESSWHDPY